MTNIYDVFAEDLIEAVAQNLMEEDDLEPPKEAMFWKTGHYKEYPPNEFPKFWYVRAASMLRKLYRKPIGVNRFRKIYGGKKQGTHVHLNHSALASGAIIRRILQQLEKCGMVETSKKDGRTLTNKGRSFLDKTAAELQIAE